MKKFLLTILFLPLLSCTTDKATKTLTNCADYLFSQKNLKRYPSNFWTLSAMKVENPKNKLEQDINILVEDGNSYDEITDWFDGLVKYKGSKKSDYGQLLARSVPYTKESSELAKKIRNDSNKKVKKFISLKLEKKLENNSYEEHFSRCEYNRKRRPKTFDAKWKKSKVVYFKL